MLGQALNLINGPDDRGRPSPTATSEIAKLVQREKDDAKLVEEVFLRVLSRVPTSREVEHSHGRAQRRRRCPRRSSRRELAEYETTTSAEAARVGEADRRVLVGAAAKSAS